MDAKSVLEASQSWTNQAPESRRVSAIGAQLDFEGHIRTFESGIGQLVEAAKLLGVHTELGLALPFSPVEHGATESYRRALKKYTHSPIFRDLNISLILVRAENEIEVILAQDVNAFLAKLNQLIRNFKEKHR